MSPDSQIEANQFAKAESAEPSLDTERRGEAREEDVATTGSSAGVEAAHRVALNVSESLSAGEHALTRSASRQQIDRLLDEALSNFHATGPLVNPLERTASSSSMDMRIRFVCEAKGFDYGIFWGYDDDKKSLTCASKTCLSTEAAGVAAHRVALNVSESLSAGEHALTRSASRQQIDRLLDEALSNFHATGPLVNPLERTASSSSMDMRIRFVCEAKGFDYGIFWGYDDDKKSLTCASKTCLSTEAAGVKLFVETSSTMFARYSMGFGMPGRIGYTGNYEWHEDIRQLPAWSFQRKRQAEQANLRTVIGVPLDHGVVEFGALSINDHNVATVQYIQKLCQVSQNT